ncbi:unnamed protein product [Brassica rapa subsp. trilocularis]
MFDNVPKRNNCFQTSNSQCRRLTCYKCFTNERLVDFII